MNISLKNGVRVEGIAPEMAIAFIITSETYRLRKEKLVITSITDGRHMVGSLHHVGKAIDIRLPANDKESLTGELARRLGKDFDVVLETDHIHIEYDPK